LTVGEVVGAHGLHGELRVAIHTDDPHRFGRLDTLFFGLEGTEPVPRSLLGYRLHKRQVLLRIEGCTDRAMAEALRGYLVQVLREEAIPLEEGEYFEHQILDLDTWTTGGEHLGKVVEIIHTGANDVYVVQGGASGRREVLIPAIEDVVLEIDLAAGRMIVELPDGLL
jgi:16S rRNA processing protein RimM